MMNRFAAILVILSFVGASLAQAEDEPRPFVFGMNPGTSHRELRAVKAEGGTNIRIGCGWDLVEKTPGMYDFSGPDHDVKMCMEYDLEPFFLVVATPKWALAPEKRDKPWGWAPESEFYPHARRFYRMLAARYRGQVKYYEFWNEENGYGWHAINRPEEYAPILKVAYEALKEGDPDCQVAVGGLDGSGWKGYTRYLERLYDLGCGDHFDAVAVHPYRVDGPIDAPSLKRIHEILKSHGDGNKKLWLTEYGWSNEYGHDNKARWLRESLDLLTSPELHFVFQASIHTLADFDDAEYGMCDRHLNPRAAYQVFRDYPKDWNVIAELHAQPEPPSLARIENGDFEEETFAWTPYGDGMVIRKAEDLGILSEAGSHLIAAPTDNPPHNGGVFLRVPIPERVPVRLEGRVFTDQHDTDPKNSLCRLGIDPTGGTDPKAETVVWGRTMDTSGVWDSIAVGQGDPILPQADRVTLFLEYIQKGENAEQVSAFDQLVFEAKRATFVLPEVEPIPFEAMIETDPPPITVAEALRADRLVYTMPALPTGDQEEFDSNVGLWRVVENGWISASGAEEGHPRFLFATCKQGLPDEDWEIKGNVFSDGDLTVGIWAGEDMDHCIMAMVDGTDPPNNVFFVERRGPGGRGFYGQTNKNAHTLSPEKAPEFTLRRQDDELRLLINGEEVTRYPYYPRPMPKFGLFVLKPDSGMFNNVRVFRRESSGFPPSRGMADWHGNDL